MVKRKEVVAKLLLEQIAELRLRARENTKRFHKTNEKIAREIDSIKKLVLHGKATTGDRISDYFIVTHGSVDAEITKPFRDVEKKMAGKVGQLFLIVQREKKRHVFRDGMDQGSRESDYHLETQYVLGILSHETLVFSHGWENYGLQAAAFGEFAVNVPFEKNSGPFMFPVFHGLQDLDKIISGGHDSGPALELLIGDSKVFAYSPSEFYRSAEWVVALNQAARVLGKNIPEAPEEKAAREEEKKRVLNLLNKGRDKRNRLLGIDPTPKVEFENCERELQSLLARAQELGLGEHTLVKLVGEEMQPS